MKNDIDKEALCITPLVIREGEASVFQPYSDMIMQILHRRIPKNLLFFKEERLPIFSWVPEGAKASNLSIFLFCKHRPHVIRFLYEMLSRWLIPGKRVDSNALFSAHFKIANWGSEVYTVVEVVMPSCNSKEMEAMIRSLTSMESEILWGVSSSYHAGRILETRGISIDEKSASIQEIVASLIRRRPQDFDYDIFSQMQHFLVARREEFKGIRECRHMSRIIYIFYLFRKALLSQVEYAPGSRYLSFKLVKTRLHLPLGVRQVLSIFIGMNMLKKNEIFDESHLLSAVRKYIPNVRAVEDSFFVKRSGEDRVRIFYLEVDKEDESPFTLEEIRCLRKGMPEDLQSCVETLRQPLFMPRNEEEVMRNILVLGKQLKYKQDLPQLIISFNDQTDIELSFTVILVRILQPNSVCVQKIASSAHADFTQLKVDRVKKIGMLRNKYPKEAIVLRVGLSSASFLRKDHSVDLYRVRLKVIEGIQAIFGEVRDYNGGMIAKQAEAFKLLQDMLGEKAREHDFLLENFFHAIFPIELRSIVPLYALRDLFCLLLKLRGEREFFLWDLQESYMCVLFLLQEEVAEEELAQAINGLHLTPPQLICLRLEVSDAIYLGYIYFCSDAENQKKFKEAVFLFGQGAAL